MPGQCSTPQLLLGVTAEFCATKAFSWGISGKGTFVGQREGAQRVGGGGRLSAERMGFVSGVLSYGAAWGCTGTLLSVGRAGDPLSIPL